MSKKVVSFHANMSGVKWVAIITFFSHFSFNFVLRHISALPTGLASKSAAAYLAGYDWSSVMAKTNYYGTGFYILLSPIYFLTSNAYVVYYFTVFLLAVMISVQAVLCFKIQQKFLKVKNEKLAIVISLITSFLPVIPSNVAINEPPLEFVIWMVLYLFLECIWEKNRNKCIAYLAVMGILLLWSRTIHERAIVFICSFVIVFIFIFLIYKKDIFLIIPLAVSSAITGVAAWIYIKWAKECIWMGTVTGRNTIGHEIEKATNSMVSLFFTKEGFASFVHIIVSQITTATIYSCGLFMLAFIWLFYELFRILKYYFMKRKIADGDMTKLVIILMFGMAAIATILFMGISCLVGVYNAEQNGEGTRVYCFLRYFYVFVPPLIMLTLSDLCNGNLKYKVIGVSSFVSLLFLKFFDLVVCPVIAIKKDPEIDRFHYLSPMSGRGAEEFLTMRHISICSLCLIGCFIMLYLLYSKRRYWTLITVFGVLLVYTYGYMNFNFWKSASEKYYSLIDSTKEYICGNEEINQKITQIYAGELNQCYMLLSEIPQYHVLCDIPAGLGKGEILIVSSPKKTAQYTYEYCIQLDENEYVMFDDAELNNLFY